MIYGELPRFDSKYAWTLPEEAGKTYTIDGALMAPSGAPALSGVYLPEYDPFRHRIHDVGIRGSVALAAQDEAARLREIDQLNDELAEVDPVYALVTTTNRVGGRPDWGRLGRIAILRGFIFNPRSLYANTQVNQVLEDKEGNLGHRYAKAFVLFPIVSR